MAVKGAKRQAPSQRGGPSKKPKLAKGSKSGSKNVAGKGKDKGKGKERAYERDVVEIPAALEDAEAELSEEDLELLNEYADNAKFLSSLDPKAIGRSKKETERLHRMNKPVRVTRKDDLPDIDSNDEDEDENSWSSDIEEGDFESDEPGSASAFPSSSEADSELDPEELYESRQRPPAWTSEPEPKGVVNRLPIKLADGRIQKTEGRIRIGPEDEESSEESMDSSPEEAEASRVEDVSTGARFGRPAVIDVIGSKSRKARIEAAKEQIASICQEIVADPENSLGLLRRLHTFSLPSISTPTHPEPVTNDPTIRKLAMLSQLAVYKDIIPGYRIRPLTDKEKAEKVSQIVARTREYEQGLVGVYQTYLRALEAEVKGQTELADIALQSMCTLLVEVTHFNFRMNLMNCIVARLSKKSWDKSSELCLNTIVKVFRQDLTGAPSLELVRLLNRMIRERKYNVHPNVLSCLLHLRLKTELNVRASESKAEKEGDSAKGQQKRISRHGKGKKTDAPHLSKKAKKVLKEQMEIQKEMKEAAAEVDREERAATQTETLKLLFVLYFRILKNPEPTALLPAALEGISKFSHLVNIDFFKDLMQVLKSLVLRDSKPPSDDSLDDVSSMEKSVRYRLTCITTAFELLIGQGEALTLDLTDFNNLLYALIPALGLIPDIERIPLESSAAKLEHRSIADMFFRALDLVFSPRMTQHSSPAWRSAAFAKRVLSTALHWPPASAVRAIHFVERLIVKDTRLDYLLSTEDRTFNGVYRPDIDDPQLCNPSAASLFEVHILANQHWDVRVRDEALNLVNFIRQ
ncbi:nucleolar complex-associated protein 3 [Gloeophyllum trabeum ATCC 11539]|uniref:Nucleolar complex-associated protein 3 n=1 Tax=Gloeophyllum trabeum (strain ATCC 11539 / FP-39264 / Madison 617) TaxID=670483 RepID=S7QG57_GLOTA|nr:nucleolar complex-associated protein 3 [Gloeophyllum trabeum ATCC 11539]EPQ58153.1 nucleolar complex-associated protein 3 [Gloeophyllum trabeum ATCC 11539]